MKPIFLFAFFVLAGLAELRAQNGAEPSTPSVVIADPRLQELVEKHKELNQRGKGKGYRVQLYFGSDKTKANEVKSKFLTLYGRETRAYDPYDQPNFKVRVGDFRTRLEAYKFLKEIREHFPGAFIVESEIEWPEIEK